LTDQTQNLIMA